MDYSYWVLFAFYTFVERVDVSDLFDLPIIFGKNEARSYPFGDTVFFKDSNSNHMLEFLFECLFMSMGNQSSIVYQFQSRY